MKKIFFLCVALLSTMAISANTLPKMTINVTSGSIGTEWNDNCTMDLVDDNNVIGGAKSGVAMSVEYSGSGNSKNYRIKFAKKKYGTFFGDDITYKQWVLLSNNDDATKMRNALADEISTAVGMDFTPRYQFVDLYINGTYAGIYQLTDRVKAENGRAMVGDASDIDWLVQMSEDDDVSSSDTYVTGTETMPFIVMKNPDPDDYADDQTTLNGYKNDMQTYFTSFFANAENKIKQDEFIAWYIASEIICNYKGLDEIYAYRSTYGNDQLLRFGPIWDNEKGFNNNSSHPLDMSDLNTSDSNDGLIIEYAKHDVIRHWLKNLWLDKWFAKGVLDKWETLSGLKQTLLNKITILEGSVGNSDAESDLKTYITDRFAYLDAKFSELAAWTADDKTGSDALPTLTYNVKKKDALTAWSNANNKTVNVQLNNRGTIHGGEWNAICLPFALNEDKITSVFGEGTEVKEFNSVTTKENSVVGFKFSTVTSMEASTPYIIKPTNDISSLIFNDVTFCTDEAKTVTKDGYSFVGTLNASDITADGNTLVMQANNKVCYLDTDATLHGCRAYFTIPNSAAKSFVITFDNENTGINNINSNDSKSANIYSISGQVIGIDAKTLSKGIYIINGKKVIK